MYSSPYYTQANKPVEATNKIIIDLIKKNIEDKTNKWHETLQKTLCAIRNSKTTTTSFIPYRLTYDQDVVFPLVINVASLRLLSKEISTWMNINKLC